MINAEVTRKSQELEALDTTEVRVWMGLKTEGLITRQFRKQSLNLFPLEGSPVERLNQRDFISSTAEEEDTVLKNGKIW